ncbi:hypothetical protein CONPUDRAFT_154499 [Coniophora puteana RWD-64-598 SS2]|uniref:Saccharopine dehydrogenase-like C-terminal domain-containing protein n=1 Tax=Coniophora puteana (strain RWD-64-598) TaxID=741705 RepID=A0A5M3MMR0_CONPW|nr:uncharacterized protein CONPUDRAFT_154499 [Coniophora puteana RWD-64-598 SS2]EIW80469.1 hypothetical protein CONPUDRAFT_154499 [Coniophora puteana RWD-64-598 SS2]
MAVGALLLINFTMARRLFRRIMPKPGEGPSDEQLQKGKLEVINVTTSVPDPSKSGRTVSVRSTLNARGDAAYLVSSILVAECALALALDHDALPACAREGGVLTPAIAFGGVLIERLNRLDDRFRFESEITVPTRP